MRYRKLDVNGDYSFGHGQADFYRDVPDAPGQATKTRLALFTGEWFLDLAEGTPWGGFPINTQVVGRGLVLGKGNRAIRELVIKERILDTQGVLSIDDFSSFVDSNQRFMSFSATVTTIYGRLLIQATPDNTVIANTTTGFEINITPLDSTGAL